MLPLAARGAVEARYALEEAEALRRRRAHRRSHALTLSRSHALALSRSRARTLSRAHLPRRQHDLHGALEDDVEAVGLVARVAPGGGGSVIG